MTDELHKVHFGPGRASWRCDVNSDHEEFELAGKIYRRARATGMRVGEMITLRPMDVREGKIHVRAEVTKADETRQIGVRADVAEALAAQTTSAPDQRYWPLPQQAIRERLAEASRLAEIPRVYPHALRKTMATRCAVKGFPLVMLQKILGHSSPTVTAKFYVGIDDSTRAEAFVALAL